MSGKIEDLEFTIMRLKRTNRELSTEVENLNKALENMRRTPQCTGKMFNRQAVFLDRDGTLIESVIRHEPKFWVTAPFTMKELAFVPRVYPALTKLKNKGLLRVMVTNQPCVRYGYTDEDVWQKIQKKVEHTLGLDAIYMCRHRDEDKCDRRKPSPKMLSDAADNLGIELTRSWMVGDTILDMKAGRGAGCKTILINHSYNVDMAESEYDHRVGSLVEAVELILTQTE